jgi:hypothetical protein
MKNINIKYVVYGVISLAALLFMASTYGVFENTHTSMPSDLNINQQVAKTPKVIAVQIPAVERSSSAKDLQKIQRELAMVESRRKNVSEKEYNLKIKQLESQIEGAKAEKAEAIRRFKAANRPPEVNRSKASNMNKNKNSTISQGSNKTIVKEQSIAKKTPLLRFIGEDHVVVEIDGELTTVFDHAGSMERFKIKYKSLETGRVALFDRKKNRTINLSVNVYAERETNTAKNEEAPAPSGPNGASNQFKFAQ